MVRAKTLFLRLLFILVFELLKVAALFFSILYLPLRLLRKSSTPSSSAPRPAVHLTTHEPAATYSQPRDTLVFIHGFPDCASLWDSALSRLTDEGYRCITVDLPGSKGEPIPHILAPADILKMIVDALRTVCQTPVTFIAHDFGALYSTWLRRQQPHLMHRLILLDIGSISRHSDTHWTTLLCMLSYQSTLALLFFLGAPCTRVLHSALTIFNYRVRPFQEITTDMTYHYAGVLLAIAKHVLGLEKISASEGTQDRVPHLFIYARRKLFNFHDSAFVEKVRSTPCGEVVALPCGHWMMAELPEEWLRIVTEWLQKSETEIPPAR